MKTSVLTSFKKILFLLGVFAFISLELAAQNAERIRIIVGTRSHPSPDGKGCEGEKGFCFIFGSTNKIVDSDAGIAEIQIVRGQIQTNIISDPTPAESDENTFFLYEDKILPQETAEALGYSKIILRKGEYRLDKSRNPLGTVLLNASFY